MVKYTKLTLIDREEISRLLAAGNSIRYIAKIMGRSPSTVSREIKRYMSDKKYYVVASVPQYRATYAQYRCNFLRHKVRKNRKLISNRRLWRIVRYYLFRKWSPEQIAKRLVLLYPDDMNMRISHETIYSYLYVLPKGTLRDRIIKHLRRSHKHRQKIKSNYKKPGNIQDFLSIEERPKEIADRIMPGHWEGDLIIGRKNASAIGTLVERTTRMTFLVKLANQDARVVRRAFAEEFRHLPSGLKKSLTYDQGSEMSQHKLFTKETDITVYFAHPHSPWERGSNENTNSLIRQYFPRGTDFDKISYRKLKKVQDELNDRPRKTLGWHTPHEQFSKVLH